MNIALIGMMGCGKSTIAKELVKRISGFSLVDTDSLIVNLQKMSINDIFSKYGESFFRKIESEILEDVLKKDNQIIATGGGIIKSDKNILLLKDNSKVFYLNADEDTLFERVKNNKERPLLNTDGVREKIHLILNERRERYSCAHFEIDTSNKSIDIIADEIIRKSGIYGKC